MKVEIGLLLMLVRVSLGEVTSCDGRQNKAQCYGALGGSLVIRLMDNLPEEKIFTWLETNTGRAEQWTSKGPRLDVLSNKLKFIPSNGTMRVNHLLRTDAGEYQLTIHNKDGKRTAGWTLQLNIQAPVWPVQLKSECLSQGEKRMSCSSEGDGPDFSWTLNGDTLTDDQILSRNHESNEIFLKPRVSGKLVCTVRNHISEASGTEMIPPCGEVTSHDGRQNKAQCYGALGRTLVIRLINKLPEKKIFTWLDTNTRATRWTSPWDKVLLTLVFPALVVLSFVGLIYILLGRRTARELRVVIHHCFSNNAEDPHLHLHEKGINI